MAVDLSQPVSSPGFVNGTPDWVKPLIEQAAQTHNIPTIILSALLKQESGFDPNAKSPVGAMGIAQFMPGTAKGMGVDAWDPESAINGAAQYLANGLKKYGKIDLALAAYNAGGGAVDKFGGVPPYKETQNYVKDILAMAGQPHATANQPAMDVLREAMKNAKARLPKAPQDPYQSGQATPSQNTVQTASGETIPLAPSMTQPQNQGGSQQPPMPIPTPFVPSPMPLPNENTNTVAGGSFIPSPNLGGRNM